MLPSTGPFDATQARTVVLRFLLRTTSMVVLLTGAYYTWPSRDPTEDATSAARLVGALVSSLLVLVVVRAQLRSVRQEPRLVTVVEALLAALYFIVVAFAAVYYRMATTTDQFAGLDTKTDGLYFTVTIVSTVGFGDIHAVGGAARALVTAQMLFSLMFLGTAIRLLSAVQSRYSAPSRPAQQDAGR